MTSVTKVLLSVDIILNLFSFFLIRYLPLPLLVTVTKVTKGLKASNGKGFQLVTMKKAK
jgi:hypothetical protein